MRLEPQPNDILQIGKDQFRFMPHPAVPAMAFGQEGRKSMVFQLHRASSGKYFALKIFKPAFRGSYILEGAQRIAAYHKLLGMSACRRTVLTRDRYADLLNQYPVLEYSVIMPWVGGQTWHDLVGKEESSLSSEQSLEIAETAARVLSTLEAKNLAHCDIASGNVLIDLDQGQVNLVDLEDMYGAHLAPPNAFPAGTAGYQHRTSRANPHGQWCAEGDRFSSAILLAEMLTWHDHRIVKLAYGGHYFAEREMQDAKCERYALMLQVLLGVSKDLAELFEQAWRSQRLTGCPPLSQWINAIAKAKVSVQPVLKIERSWGYDLPGPVYDTYDQLASLEMRPVGPDMAFPVGEAHGRPQPLKVGMSSSPQAPALRQLQGQLMGIFEVISVDAPESPEEPFRFRGHLQRDSELAFAELSRRFELIGYTPTLARDDKEANEDVLTARPGVARPRPAQAKINLVLFVATVFTMLGAGSVYAGGNLLSGIPFALTLLTILGTCALGQYFVAHHHQIAVTLPYFIPIPSFQGFPTLGTFGAFLQIRMPIRDRKQLFDMGVAHPLVGFVVGVPLLIYGLSTSPVVPLPEGSDYRQTGSSLLYMGLKHAVYGDTLAGGQLDVAMNSVASAAWVGLLVVFLNLMPMGQLNGGRIAYALWGRRASRLSFITLTALLVMGLFIWSGWFFWVLLGFLFGLRHPPPLNDHTPLDRRRKALGLAMAVLFIVLFVPAPWR
jgi:membrane-associated protease RseP (regulator of RpoE activity)